MSATRQCARPGCGGTIAAWLSYDYAGQRVWLDDLASEMSGHHAGLCAAHAGRLRPPVGWSCLDRRIERPPVTTRRPPPAPAAAAAVAAPLPPACLAPAAAVSLLAVSPDASRRPAAPTGEGGPAVIAF